MLALACTVCVLLLKSQAEGIRARKGIEKIQPNQPGPCNTCGQDTWRQVYTKITDLLLELHDLLSSHHSQRSRYHIHRPVGDVPEVKRGECGLGLPHSSYQYLLNCTVLLKNQGSTNSSDLMRLCLSLPGLH